MRKPPIRCLGGMYPLPTGGFVFSVVHNEEHGWYIWDGETAPDQFANGDGHVYEVQWCDERVEFILVEENIRIKLLPYPIWPVNKQIMTAMDVDFYTIRNRVRELGREASRSDFESFIHEVAPHISVGV